MLTVYKYIFIPLYCYVINKRMFTIGNFAVSNISIRILICKPSTVDFMPCFCKYESYIPCLTVHIPMNLTLKLEIMTNLNSHLNMILLNICCINDQQNVK